MKAARAGAYSVRSWFPYSFAALTLLLLGVVSAYLWLEVKERFPSLPAGDYQGVIQGTEQSQGGDTIKVFVRSAGADNVLLWMVFAPGWLPQSVSTVPSGVEQEDRAQWFFPITLNAPNTTYKLIGSSAGVDRYAGSLVNMQNKKKGNWELTALHDAPIYPTPTRVKELQLWLLLRNELAAVEAQIVQVEKQAPLQRQEIERLTNIITEGTGLKLKADQKFLQVKSELSLAQQKLKTKQEEASKLEGQINISQRITGMGKLVSLARETLEREARWVDSMLKSNPSKDDLQHLEEEFRRAEQIMELKRAVELETERIARFNMGLEQGSGAEFNPQGR